MGCSVVFINKLFSLCLRLCTNSYKCFNKSTIFFELGTTNLRSYPFCIGTVNTFLNKHWKKKWWKPYLYLSQKTAKWSNTRRYNTKSVWVFGHSLEWILLFRPESLCLCIFIELKRSSIKEESSACYLEHFIFPPLLCIEIKPGEEKSLQRTLTQ